MYAILFCDELLLWDVCQMCSNGGVYDLEIVLLCCCEVCCVIDLWKVDIHIGEGKTGLSVECSELLNGSLFRVLVPVV